MQQQVLVVCPETQTFTIIDSDNVYQLINSKVKHPALDQIKQQWVENYAKMMYRADYIQDTIYVEMYVNSTALMIPSNGFSFTPDSNTQFRVNGVACFIMRDCFERVHMCHDHIVQRIKKQVSFVNPQYNSEQAEVLAMMRATVANTNSINNIS